MFLNDIENSLRQGTCPKQAQVSGMTNQCFSPPPHIPSSLSLKPTNKQKSINHQSNSNTAGGGEALGCPLSPWSSARLALSEGSKQGPEGPVSWGLDKHRVGSHG